MNVTSVKIYPFDAGISQGSLRAYADVILDDSVLIKRLGYWPRNPVDYLLACPRKKGKMASITIR